MQPTSHHKRIASGLVLLAVLAGCLYLGGWPLRIFIGLAGALALWEFYRMLWPGRALLPDKAAGLAGALLLCLFDSPIALPALFLYAAMRFLLKYGRRKTVDSPEPAVPDQPPDAPVNLADQALLVFGFIYLPMSLHLIAGLELLDQLAVFLAVAASDTGAYYAGSFLGRHKIWPKVSPQKSTEGALGGLCASLVLLIAFGLLIYAPERPGFTVLDWALAGILLSIAAQMCDFFESAIKRRFGVKDSGNLIPGHGGVLDRLDSLVFALPVYVFICRPLMAA